MPTLPFVTLDVFTRTRYQGNPLAVVTIPVGRDVATETMQTIAREFNLSETIFVHEGVDGEDGVREWRVRIFLVRGEVPFAGHPTIGAAVHALSALSPASRGRLLANAGPIELEYTNNTAQASIPHNFHLHTLHPFTLPSLHTLQPSLQDTPLSQTSIALASPVKGMTFIMVALPSLSALGKITSSAKPAPKLDDYDGWDTGFCGSYFYVVTSERDDYVALQSRMIEGSFEDPATGSAACGLCSMLALRSAKARVCRFEVTQGVEMGRRSDIGVTITLDESLKAVEKVELSGSAVKVMEGVVEY